MSLSSKVADLATAIAHYLRDTILPRLIPAGGATGNVLRKASGSDYAVEWGEGGGGGSGGSGVVLLTHDFTANPTDEISFAFDRALYDYFVLDMSGLRIDASELNVDKSAAFWGFKVYDGATLLGEDDYFSPVGDGYFDGSALQETIPFGRLMANVGRRQIIFTAQLPVERWYEDELQSDDRLAVDYTFTMNDGPDEVTIKLVCVGTDNSTFTPSGTASVNSGTMTVFAHKRTEL